ncbi:MAG TPA: sugar phosphate isomerase/epimerase [Candidatus Limnocylindrales bacterium]|nr:sugar phosphate isomerase/epimerase [Candidatus Limnocylindrales bacterium]
MEIGLYTDSLSSLPFEEMLDVAAASGVTAIEIATGGQSSAPHLDVDALLASASARATFQDAFASRGLRIAALNCSAWPMHPVVGAAHSALIDKTLRLAAELGVTKIVTMSGCPGDGRDATTVNWVWYPWPDDAVALGRRGWDEGVAFWTDKVRRANEAGVDRIAFELHPLHLVYNVPTVLAFRAAVGDGIGVNLDPSHLFWQQMDPIAAVRALGRAVHHVHMKDTEIVADQVALAGVLDNRSFDTPTERAWTFRTAGRIHPASWWAQFIAALADAGYDDALSIEQEDPYASQVDGVREAAGFIAGLLAAEAVS